MFKHSFNVMKTGYKRLLSGSALKWLINKFGPLISLSLYAPGDIFKTKIISFKKV